MSVTLPRPIAAYFAATNAHDIPTMIAAFSEDAVVADERKQHRGVDAIRSWMHETIEKYAYKVEPTDFTEADGKTVVTAVVSGYFPGSPVKLSHSFTFDGTKIVRLEIR
jgi:hypothetical protein